MRRLHVISQNEKYKKTSKNVVYEVKMLTYHKKDYLKNKSKLQMSMSFDLAYFPIIFYLYAKVTISKMLFCDKST